MENKLQTRKSPRLRKYDYSKPGAYFITICTEERKCVLSNVVGDGAPDVPPHVELTDIGKIVDKYILSTNHIQNVSVDKYVIMPDHIHMIIIVHSENNVDRDDSEALKVSNGGTSRAPSPTNGVIPRTVAALKRLCNKEIGHNIFQRSYFDHVIRDKDDYDTRTQYINENPMRWYYNDKAKDDAFCEYLLKQYEEEPDQGRFVTIEETMKLPGKQPY